MSVFRIPLIFILPFLAFLSFVGVLSSGGKCRNKSKFIIFWTAILLLSARYEMTTYKGKLSIGELHRFNIHKFSSSSEITKIDGRYPVKKVYAKLDDESIESGYYEVYAEVRGLEDSRGFLYLDIDSKEIYQASFDGYRRVFLKNILRLTKDYPQEFQGFIKAVLLGDKDGIENEMKERFSYTGTAHLIVVSGLHIGTIAVICMGIFNLLRTPYQLKYILTFIILSFYCFSIGFSPSTLRAYIMGSIYIFSKIFYEETDLKKSLCLAFIISILINPTILNSVSFELSYVALFAIIFVFPKIKENLKAKIRIIEKNKNKAFEVLLDLMVISFSIQVSLTPIFLYYFKSIPLLSFLVNVVAVPLGTLFIQLSFFALACSFIYFGKFLMPLTYAVYRLLMVFIGAASKLPIMTVEIYREISPLFFIYLYLCLMLFIFYWVKAKKNIFSIVIVGIIVFNMDLNSASKSFEFRKNRYIGNSESILIVNEILKEKDIRLLKDNGVKNIDVLVSLEEIDDKFVKTFDVVQSINLKNGETLIYKDYVFKNTNGRIVTVEGCR